MNELYEITQICLAKYVLDKRNIYKHIQTDFYGGTVKKPIYDFDLFDFMFNNNIFHPQSVVKYILSKIIIELTDFKLKHKNSNRLILLINDKDIICQQEEIRYLILCYFEANLRNERYVVNTFKAESMFNLVCKDFSNFLLGLSD